MAPKKLKEEILFSMMENLEAEKKKEKVQLLYLLYP